MLSEVSSDTDTQHSSKACWYCCRWVRVCLFKCTRLLQTARVARLLHYTPAVCVPIDAVEQHQLLQHPMQWDEKTCCSPRLLLQSTGNGNDCVAAAAAGDGAV